MGACSPLQTALSSDSLPPIDSQYPTIALQEQSWLPQAPAPASQCDRFYCGSVGQHIIDSEQYQSVLQSSSCNMSNRQGTCLVSSGPLAFDIYGSIKSGSCIKVSTPLETLNCGTYWTETLCVSLEKVHILVTVNSVILPRP